MNLRYILLAFVFSFVLISVNEQVIAQNTQLTRHQMLNSYTPRMLPAYRDALETVTRYDFWIQMSDGVMIDCLKFIPNGTPPAGGWPTVIMVHGYGDSKETLAHFCKAQAEYGYYTMAFSVRGQGFSGGLSNLISRTEMNDLLQIINWVKADSVNGSSPGKILIMGGSQGGALPYMAACNGANVKTIITSVAPPDFASSWIENGSIKMTLLWTIEYPSDTARYSPQVDRMSDWIYADNKEKWDSLAYWLPIDRDFINDIPNCSVPMLVEATWQDKFFNASGVMTSLPLLQVPFSSYIGAVHGHGGDQSASEDVWHMQWFNDWFFYWLFGVENGILNHARFQYATTTHPRANGMWSFVHDSSSIPLQDISTNLRLYFRPNKKLLQTPYTGTTRATIRNQVASGYTLQQAIWDEFKGTNFDNKFKVRSIYFETAPLTAELELTGTPKINLDYLSTANVFCQYNFQIYEVLPTGQADFVNRINYTDRNYVKNSRRTRNFKGQTHSHRFKTGSKIRIVVTNLDRVAVDSAFFGTNPFVLPSMKNGYNYMYLNSNSYIDLPVVLPGASSPFVNVPEETITPFEYSLSQNYPNPFNPVTNIEFSIAKAGKVELKVYDIIGREVQTLVNDYREAGNYKITANFLNISSGVYFYKLISGDFQEVKRMVLIK